MKKILMVSLLVFSFFLVAPQTLATDTGWSDAIFKIQAYSHDKITDMYVLKQYGSAVLVANNLLLTNAHVVTDDGNAFTLQYEACQTIDDDQSPKCFSTLQLIRYDKDADLALLQIVNPSDDMPEPVIIGSGTLSVGTNIRIIGYPANGGATITTTQGTIAGYESNYYKTDANVDEGNSWWGSFDSAGNFIGIPTFVVNGQTTLGYIIPTDTIKEFLAGDIGTSFTVKYSATFDKRLQSRYSIQEKGKIDNNLFKTPDFKALWLNLDVMVEKQRNNLYTYSLSNANASIIDMESLIATDNASISRYIGDTMKKLKENDMSPKRSTKRVGTMTWTVISFGGEDRVGYDYIQTSSTNKTYLEFTVRVDKEDVDADLADMIGFVEDTIVKKLSIKPQPFNLPMVKLSSKRNVGIVKWMKEDGLSLTLYPTDGKYVTEITAYIGEKTDTLKKVTKQMKNIFENMDRTVDNETSKYPTSLFLMSVTDDNDEETLHAIGMKKYGSSNLFIYITSTLYSSTAKQNVINLSYKILGLE